jgi:hypothetical protein
VLFASETMAVCSGDRKEKFLVRRKDLAAQVTVKLAPVAEENTELPFEFMCGGGWRKVDETDSRLGIIPPFHLELNLSPSAFLHIPDAVACDATIQGGSLVLSSTNLSLRANADTGRLEMLSYHSSNELYFNVSFRKGAFDQASRELDYSSASFTNRYDPGHPLSSMVGFGIRELTSWNFWSLNATNSTPAQRQVQAAAIGKLLGSSVLAPLDEHVIASNETEQFSLPLDATDLAVARNTMVSVVGQGCFRLCDGFFEKRSWPWTASRELVFILAGIPVYSDAEFSRVYESEDTGPVACLAIATLLARLNSPAARTFAVQGMTRLEDTDFRNDTRLLMEGKSGLARTFENFAEALRNVTPEEEDSLASLLPADEAEILKECIHALRSAKTSPPSDVLGPILDKYWTKSLRGKVTLALKRLAAFSRNPAPQRN